MLKMKLSFCLIAGATFGLVSYASAAPMLQLQLLTSTTGAANSYVSGPPSSSPYTSTITAAPSTELYYELVVQSAAPGTTNTHSGSKTPNGTTDELSSLPTLTYTLNGGTFASATLSTQFADGGTVSSGPNGGSTGSNGSTGAGIDSTMTVLTLTAESTSYLNDDSQLVLATGSLTVGSQGSTTATGAYNGSPLASGFFRIAATSGLSQSATSATESSSDPYLGYAVTPEPASLSLLGLGGLAMMRRRRNGTLAGAKA